MLQYPTIAMLERSDDELTVPLNYERLSELLENPSGKVLTLHLSQEQEDEQKGGESLLWKELAV